MTTNAVVWTNIATTGSRGRTQQVLATFDKAANAFRGTDLDMHFGVHIVTAVGELFSAHIRTSRGSSRV